MFWHEEEQEPAPKIPDDVVDLAFSMKCDPLPVDHASILFNEIDRVLPWFKEEHQCALHTIHAGDTGNGWARPEEGSALIHPSKRTKLILRLPKHRIDDAKILEGETLLLENQYKIELSTAKTRLMSISSALYARYVTSEPGEEEEQFLQRCVQQLHHLGISFKKILAGKSHQITIKDKMVSTRSLFVADLKFEDAFVLQQNGIGAFQYVGCGIFIPHKTIS